MKRSILGTVLLPMCLVGGGCSLMDNVRDQVGGHGGESMAAPGLKDGELAVPEGYRDWPVFLAEIDKVDAGQIRDIYISPAGSQTKQGDAFPDGTISVMEIWNPQRNGDGELAMDSDGKLIKADLKSIFLMGKSTGAGEMVPAELRNGDWVYAAYQADGVTPVGGDATACRACHTPQADNDWVFRYDEYFAKRGQ